MGKDLISLTIVFVLQIIIGLPFKYAVYTSGPAFFLGSLVKWYTTHTTLDTIGDAPLWMHVVCMVFFPVFVTAAFFESVAPAIPKIVGYALGPAFCYSVYITVYALLRKKWRRQLRKR